MNLFPSLAKQASLFQKCALAALLLSVGRANSAPYIVSTVPFSGATGVAIATTITITFSETMNSSLTTVLVYDGGTYEILPSSLSWNPGATVATCTPESTLPAGHTIWWTVLNGQNPAGVPLTGYSGGAFTTQTGSQIILTNAAWSGGLFAFDITSAAGLNLTVEYSTTMRSNQWQTVVTTNSTTGHVHIVDPHSATNRFLFYRARTS